MAEPFTYTEGTGFRDYQGFSKEALEVLIRILDMPQHRAILTGRG